MAFEKTGEFRSVYQLQQSQLMYINRLGESLENICGEMESLGSLQSELTGKLQECANRSRVVIRRLEKKTEKNKDFDGKFKIFSKTRIKSLLRALNELYGTSCLAADTVHGFSRNQQHMADLLGLSVLTIRHFLWREKVFMAVILGKCNTDTSGSDSAVTSSAVRLYEGKKSYTHLPEYRSLKDVHLRYGELVNKIIENYDGGLDFSGLSGELIKLEQLNQQFMGCIDQLQHHVNLLLQGHSV